MLFEDAYQAFLVYAEKRHKKQGFVTLVSNFNSQIIPYFKGRFIEDISKKDILEWQNKIYDLGFKNSYNSKLYIEFSSFMKFCCEFYELPKNVVSEVGNFKKRFEDKNFDFYTLSEFNLFIKGFDNIIYKQFFTFLFFTGCRPGEAMAVKFSDLHDGYISINKNLTTKGGRNLDSPKNLSSIRDIKLDKFLYKELLELRKLYDTKKDCFIFGGNKPLSPTTITRYKMAACSKMGIRPITMHQFRHSHATLLLQNGMLINEVSRRLGHSKVSTTLDVYAHTDLSQEKRVFDTLNHMRFNFVTLVSNFCKISILKFLNKD